MPGIYSSRPGGFSTQQRELELGGRCATATGMVVGRVTASINGAVVFSAEAEYIQQAPVFLEKDFSLLPGLERAEGMSLWALVPFAQHLAATAGQRLDLIREGMIIGQ